MSRLPQPLGRTGSGRILFFTGARQSRSSRILPVFLPFLGCPGHCVYCAQDKQTGHTGSEGLRAILAEAAKNAAALPPCGPQERRELAFYGGTFTALPAADRASCFELLEALRREDRIRLARCSTRPDALSPAVLDELLHHGVDLVELGIQSFASEALALSRRGYDRSAALAGCRAVTGAGLSLGIQLLPGIAGQHARRVSGRRAHGAFSFARLPPLLSLPRARRHNAGALVPRRTLCAVDRGTDRAHPGRGAEHGLAGAGSGHPSVGGAGERLRAALLAGPRHPALGALIQAEALLRAAEKRRERPRPRAGKAHAAAIVSGIHVRRPRRAQVALAGSRAGPGTHCLCARSLGRRARLTLLPRKKKRRSPEKTPQERAKCVFCAARDLTLPLLTYVA